MTQDLSQRLQQQVIAAAAIGQHLNISGGNSKSFLGHQLNYTPLQLKEHSGIIHYEPVELVITARAGTPLKEIEETLAANDQMLPFEPPHYGDNATLGGTIACGLSGPSRPFVGSARDYVLGVKIINGHGEILRFGGEVMKNVAGYDVSRLMTGAMGTLGVLLEISLKVLPTPPSEVTFSQCCDEKTALNTLHRLSATPLPLTAGCYDGEQLYLRLSGSESAIKTCQKHIEGDVVEESQAFWQSVKEHTHPFFSSIKPLWRLSVPATTPPLSLEGGQFIDWGGAQRWLQSDSNADQIREVVQASGGHATLFRNPTPKTAIFHPPRPGLMVLHRNIKQAFDPKGIFNPGRLYASF